MGDGGEKGTLVEVSQSVRQTNLLLALNLCLQQHRPLTLAWVMQNVEGYLPELSQRAHPAPEIVATMRKRLERDVQAWQDAGIPIEGQITTGYKLRATEAFLPPIEFSPTELALLSNVTTLAVSNSFSEHARLGLLKLASQVAWDKAEQNQGHTDPTDTASTTRSALKIGASVDWNTSDPTDIAKINQAIQQHQIIEFSYRKSGTQQGSPSSKRALVPWALVSYHNRLYLVGWDIDHRAQRLFRFAHISNLELRTEQGPGAPDGFDGAHAIADWFASHDAVVTARIYAKGAPDLLLLRDAEQVAPDEYVLTDVSRAWLIHEAIAAAPHAVVLEPTEVRSEIRALLNEAAQKVGADVCS